LTVETVDEDSIVHTLIQLKVRDSLPLIRRYEPAIVFPPAAEIDDEFGFVVVERGEYGLQMREREGG
jgi:hypothetical protein